ncbi:MAG: glycosyltransferase family 39 protein [Planctomycetes bacterium]|nr:glycosyltransferase family 39 protein [Planctomycetota bacterium]
MNAQTSPERPHRLDAFLASYWAVLAVFGLALAIRALKLTDWSMWEDEEGSVYFSQQLSKPFPQLIPIFFYLLRGVFELTGVSVTAGRALSAGIALFSLVVFYVCFRRILTRSVVLLATLLLAVNLGHVFWSQSIRYYNLVVLFQVLSMYWFVAGFESGDYRLLALSIAAFALAMFTHFSAALLAPVYVAYLVLLIVQRERGGVYNLRGYLTFGFALAFVLAYFSWNVFQMRQLLGGFLIQSARNPVHVLTTFIFYAGAPIFALGLTGMWVAPSQIPPRIARFFAVAGVIAVLELLVIARLDVINVAWYYALFALPVYAVLAAFALVGWYQRGHQRLAMLAVSGAGIYYACFLASYFTSMHGDRPRWEEATNYVRQAANIRPGASDNPAVFATVPPLVAHYLGVEPGQTFGHPLVNYPSHAEGLPAVEQWYVVEAGHVSKTVEEWLATHCELRASFESRTGPRDRTVRVYYYKPFELSVQENR